MDKLIEELCTLYVNNFDADVFGSHNGPYFDEETPVRLLAHRIVFLCAYSKIKGTREYDDIIQTLVDRMLDSEYRPNGYTFLCRTNSNKDHTNGIIGQAWIIEALAELYEYCNDERYIKIAQELFLLHPMDNKQGIWHRVDILGEKQSCDMTFNHQLWFAAMGAYVFSCTGSAEVRQNIDCFIKHLQHNFNIYNNGLIKHRIEPVDTKSRIIYDIKDWRETARNMLKKPSMYYKEIGYHSFNLYGFALLKQFYGDVSFFRSKRFKRAITFVNSEEYKTKLRSANHDSDINAPNMRVCNLKCNRYGYGYNVSGFEIAYANKLFSDLGISEETVRELLEDQARYVIEDKVSFTMNSLIEDPVIVKARTYELVRVV